MKKRSKYRPQFRTTYTMLDEIAASPTQPLPFSKRDHQLALMNMALEAMRTADVPQKGHWEIIADCVNLLETLVEMVEITDEGGWIAEAATELALAAKRSREGKSLRLTGTGLQAVTEALSGYEMVITERPARVVIRAHRLTEIRIHEIRTGRRRPHDVEVVSL